MLPLLGPLAPVLRNVHDALQLCLLSDQHYSDGAPALGVEPGGVCQHRLRFAAAACFCMPANALPDVGVAVQDTA